MRSNSLELLEDFSHWSLDPTYHVALQFYNVDSLVFGRVWIGHSTFEDFRDSLCHLASKTDVLRLHLKFVLFSLCSMLELHQLA